MRKFLLQIIVLSLGFSTGLFAQPVIKLDKSFGIDIEDEGMLNPSVLKTSDGNYIMLAKATSAAGGDKTQTGTGYNNPWIVKFSPDGTKIWDLTLRSEFGFFGMGDIKELPDGGFIICADAAGGKTWDQGEATRGLADFWIIKISKDGLIEWDKVLGGSGMDIASSIVLSADGGYLVGGQSTSDISGEKSSAGKGDYDYWVVKLTSSGQKEWDKSFGGIGTDNLKQIVASPDGGFILTGISNSPVSESKDQARGDYDFWIIKIDDSGIQQWEKTIGGTSTEWLNYVYEHPDGSVILLGGSWSGAGFDRSEASRGFSDGWMVKLSASGVIEWDKRLGGSSSDAFFYMEPSLDGGYLVSAYSTSAAGGDKTEENKEYADSDWQGDFWLIKLSASFEKVWDKTIGGSGADYLLYATEKEEGKYLLMGESTSTTTYKPQDRSAPRKGDTDIWLVFAEEQPLPVILSSFTAYKESNTTQITWETTSEIHSDFFEIQHSTNGKTWNAVEKIHAKGESTTLQNYLYIHNNPVHGDNYYRLKMIDTNGSFTYSKIESVRFDLGLDVSIYPNPVAESIHLKVDWSKVSSVQVLNSHGEILYNSEQNAILEINTKAFKAGMYFVKVTSTDGTETIRKVVIRK